jgi:hypothetical protein
VLVTAYHGDLDAAGHQYGVSSQAWEFQLAHVDRLAEHLASALPSGTVMYVTADHGMVDVGADDKLDVDDVDGPFAVLRDGVALLGGEARARHAYARPGATADVVATWREVLGEHAWVASREEALKDGWFGPPGVVDEAMMARIGDVVAACAGNTAVIASKAEPRESALAGMHGSLTAAEQLVPLLAFPARLSSRRLEGLRVFRVVEGDHADHARVAGRGAQQPLLGVRGRVEPQQGRTARAACLRVHQQPGADRGHDLVVVARRAGHVHRLD